MSVRGHGPAMKKYATDYPGTILAGCCDLDTKKAEEFKLSFGFQKAYSDWRYMLKEVNPDAVSLVVPVKFTSEMAIEIVESGYNLLTEKPPGMSSEECSGIIKAVNESGVKAAAAFNRRYMPLVKQLTAKLLGGTIEYLRYDFFRSGRKDNDFSTTAIHGIDTAKMITGSKYSSIEVTYQPLESTLVGNIFVNGKMESGATVSINFYPDSGLTAERVTVISCGETYFLNIPIWDCPDYPGSLLHYKNGKLIKEIAGAFTEKFISSGFYDEHRDFYEALRNDHPVPHEIKDSLQSVEIMEIIRSKASAY